MFLFFPSHALSWQSCICKIFECRQTYSFWGSFTKASKWFQHEGVEGPEATQPWHAGKQPSHGHWEMSKSNTQKSRSGIQGCTMLTQKLSRGKVEGNRRQPPMKLVSQWLKMLKSFHSTYILKSSLALKYHNEQKIFSVVPSHWMQSWSSRYISSLK